MAIDSRLGAVAVVACGAAAVIGFDAAGAETFHRLTGAQIRAKFTGMEMTDNVHWADVFRPGGMLTSYEMSRKSDAKWSVDKDELCVDRGKDSGGCYQVWMAAQKVELRREGLGAPLQEGVLQRPSPRK
jgi:hypothetical protein